VKSGPASASLNSLLLTIAQTAVALAVSERTVENLISRAELVSVRVGRCRRIPKSALEAYVARLVDEQAGGDVEPLAPDTLRVVRRASGGG
jgi:excisionase family DNA binding protein